MNSALSLIILSTLLFLPAKKKTLLKKMPFTFAKGHLSFVGLFCRLCILPRAKLLPSLFTIRTDNENLENPQVLLEMMMLLNWRCHHPNYPEVFFVGLLVAFPDHF